MLKLVAILTLLLLPGMCAIAQAPKDSTAGNNPNMDLIDQIKALPDTGGWFKFYPIVRDTFNRYPNRLNIKGKIVAYTQGTSCGVFCGCGTLKIKLKRKLRMYTDSFAYLAVPCFNYASDKLIGRVVNLQVCKLLLDNRECYFNELPINSIDSKGVCFYIADSRSLGLYK